MTAAAMMSENEDKTLQVTVQVPPEACGNEDITVTCGPDVMRALGIPPQFEIDEKLISALTLPPPRLTPLPPSNGLRPGPLSVPLSRRPSRPPVRATDDAMRGVVVAIWTVAALLFGVLAVLVRSTS